MTKANELAHVRHCSAEHGLCTLSGVQLIFADPPFNIGAKYAGYKDKIAEDRFRGMIFSMASAAMEALHETGVLCLHGPDDLCELYLEWARDNRLSVERIAWINWHYSFGVCSRRNWIDARCHCLVFRRRGREHKWRPENVLVESARVRYKDKRIKDSANGGKRVPGTVWGIPDDGEFWCRVQGTSAERVKSRPNQLPELYLERLILAYTDAGDIVCDPFSGTGTTVVVAAALGRKVIGFDLDEGAVQATQARLAKGAVRVPSGRYLS